MNEFSDFGRALLIYSFCIPRILGALILLPVFSSQIVSGMLRNGIAFNLALFAYPLAAATAPGEGVNLVWGLAVMFKEMVLGLVIGFGAAVLFWAAESTGFFIDNQRGSTMASSLDPLTGSQTSPLGNLLVQTLTVIFFVGGGFVIFLGLVYKSFLVWPIFSFFPGISEDGSLYFLGLLDKIVALAVLLAAPAIIAMFLSEFSLGLVSRFAPQLNVFFLSMPVKSGVAIFMLALYAGILLTQFGDELYEIATHFHMLEALLK
ncbi:MAG: type III secretion system export apparatus subunit SctT [Chromatiaceae bacterium]|nr:type III secretion system export apparatus subunit SctT [Chromatiaceae bacterium]MCP5315846.1 type III secretion system export apparatus subunit SctT [Chromatiaceae bacterium]